MSYIGNEPIVSATRTITEIVATAGQTVFVANGGYTVGFIDVFVNGAQLQTNDFTATNGSSITLISGATAGDDIRLVAWGTFNTSSTYTQSAADATFQRRDATMVNKIINGCMRIDQRNNGASVTPASGDYTLDRFRYIASQASKVTIQQNAGSVTPPAGFTNYLGITSTSAYSVNSTDYFMLQQRIEGFNFADLNWGTVNARTVTLSFWVYSSLTGTFGGAVFNSSQNRSYPFSYTISSANTWTQISITIPGDTTGTWVGATNGIGAFVQFSLGAGSTVSGTAGAWAGAQYFSATGATSVVGTSGATFYITGVDLRKGSYSTAPTFDMRQYGQEFVLCQRYYEDCNTVYLQAATGAGGSNIVTGFYRVTKRATPTLTLLRATGTGGGQFTNTVDNWSASATPDGNGRIGWAATSSAEL